MGRSRRQPLHGSGSAIRWPYPSIAHSHSQQQQQEQEQQQQPEQQWPIYEVSLLIKSFELRFIKQASTVIRDLMLLCFAPKSIYALPPNMRGGQHLLGSVRDTPVALAVPLGDRALKTRRTIFTVIRGPHIHKASREQFQRLVHRRVITYPTNSRAELEWFLDALKSYDFTGVEIKVKITSSSHLVAAPTGAAEAAARPLLAEHMAKFPHLFPDAAYEGSGGSGSGVSSGVGSSSAGDVGAMAASFEALRAALRAEALGERAALQGSEEYRAWAARLGDGAGVAAAAAAAAAASDAGAAGGGLAALGRAVAAELARSGWSAADAPLEDATAAAAQKVLLDAGLPARLSAGSSGGGESAGADALAAAIKKLPLQELAAGSGGNAALLGALHGALSEAVAAERRAGAGAGAAEAYADVARGVARELLARWFEAERRALRGALGLPSAADAQRMLKQASKQQQQQQQQQQQGGEGAGGHDGRKP